MLVCTHTGGVGARCWYLYTGSAGCGFVEQLGAAVVLVEQYGSCGEGVGTWCGRTLRSGRMPPQWVREFGGENAAVDCIYIAALPRLVYASIVGIRMALVMMAELKLVHGTSRIMKSWLTKKQDEETREAVALGCRNRSGVVWEPWLVV